MKRRVWVVESRRLKFQWMLRSFHWTKVDAQNDAKRYRSASVTVRVVRYTPDVPDARQDPSL